MLFKNWKEFLFFVLKVNSDVENTIESWKTYPCILDRNIQHYFKKENSLFCLFNIASTWVDGVYNVLTQSIKYMQWESFRGNKAIHLLRYTITGDGYTTMLHKAK